MVIAQEEDQSHTQPTPNKLTICYAPNQKTMMTFKEMKEEGHWRLSFQVLISILANLNIHPAYKINLGRNHHQMLQELYLKGSERKAKTHDREIALIKWNFAISILTAYLFILRGTQGSPVGRWTDFGKSVINTTYFSKKINMKVKHQIRR